MLNILNCIFCFWNCCSCWTNCCWKFFEQKVLKSEFMYDTKRLSRKHLCASGKTFWTKKEAFLFCIKILFCILLWITIFPSHFASAAGATHRQNCDGKKVIQGKIQKNFSYKKENFFCVQAFFLNTQMFSRQLFVSSIKLFTFCSPFLLKLL